MKQYIPEFVMAVLALVSTNGWLRSRKARLAAEAESVENASRQNIENAKLVIEMNREHVVKPLQDEVLLLRKDVKGLRREVARFRVAVEKVSSCQYSAECPIVKELEKQGEHEESN